MLHPPPAQASPPPPPTALFPPGPPAGPGTVPPVPSDACRRSAGLRSHRPWSRGGTRPESAPAGTSAPPRCWAGRCTIPKKASCRSGRSKTTCGRRSRPGPRATPVRASPFRMRKGPPSCPGTAKNVRFPLLSGGVCTPSTRPGSRRGTPAQRAGRRNARRGSGLRSFAPPRPKLRGNVGDHGDPPLVHLFPHPVVEIGKIDEEERAHVGARCPSHRGAQRPDDRRQVTDHLGHSDNGDLPVLKQEPHPLDRQAPPPDPLHP